MSEREKNNELVSIGTVAKSFGVSDNTIRRMESAGLLTPALIKPSGYRYYDVENISRIEMILSLRALGLVYEEMREYFRDPGDFSLVYSKLFERKLFLDTLLENMRRYLKPDSSEEVFTATNSDIPCFRKDFFLDGAIHLDALSDMASAAFWEAVQGNYPVDYSKPITILSGCMDYRTFDPGVSQSLAFCVPLRKMVEGPDLYVIPAHRILSFTWYHGISLEALFTTIQHYMEEHSLRQIDLLAATFEIGPHVNKDISKDQYLLHAIIPVAEI